MSSVPKNYRSMAEFEREAIRPDLKYGFSLDDLMQDTTFEGGSDLLFDETFDAYDPDQGDDDDDY